MTGESAVRRVFEALLDPVYPPSCAACGGSLIGDGGEFIFPSRLAAPLCPECRKETTARFETLCPKCAGSRFYVSGEKNCRSCRGKKFRFGRVVALGPYQGVLRSAILRMKSARNALDAVAFARLLVETRRELLLDSDPTRVLSVPSHFFRRLVRGVDSAHDLAEEIAARLNLPYDARALRRIRWTERQAGLRKNDRYANVAGAFAVAHPDRISGGRFLLVDDILTTGATANEVTRVLLEAGAKSVSVAVLARAEGRR